MAQCASCNATILFGGHRVGEYRFCSPRCLLMARPSVAEANLAGEVKDEVQQLREDLLLVVDELQQQRSAHMELHERLDFLERAVVQLREAVRQPGATAR
jgi:hypothetical protein